MFDRFKKFKFALLALVFAASCAGVSAQKKTVPKDVLTGFEKSIEAGKIAETEKPLLDYALANPQNARALELVGRLRYRQGRLVEAAALYSRVLQLDAALTTAKINYAAILLEAAKTDEARAVLASVNPADVKNTGELLNLSRSLAVVGDFQRAVEAAEKLPVAVKNSDALPVLAIGYLGTKNRAGFDTVFALAKKRAANAAVALKFAEVLLEANLRAEAAELLRAVTTAAPRNARALILLAKEEILAKDFAQAKAHLDRAETLAPQSAELFFVRAILAGTQGDAASAVTHLEKASVLEPASVNLLSQLAFAAVRANQPRKAVEAAEKLLSLKPDEPEYLYLFGAASLQGGNLAKAQTALERFMALRPADSRGCLALGLTLAAGRDQTEPARRQLLRCLEINPANHEAKYQLGLSYKAQGDTATAIRFLEETISLAPNYGLALRDLGAVYLQAGEEQKARSALEKAVGFLPNDADTHFQLSRLYNLLGETELAKKHLEMFQKLRNTGVKSM